MNDVRVSRRGLLAGSAAVAAVVSATKYARASLVRGLSLEALVAQSEHALIVTPTRARCLELRIGNRPCLVTETELRVDGSLGLCAPLSAGITVRTLGGSRDGIGEWVSGQPYFEAGYAGVVFLRGAVDGAHWTTGMAQGHYPLLARNGEQWLTASPHLPELRDPRRSAVERLSGQTLPQAEHLIASVGTK